MADETSQGLTTSMPISAPPTPTPPAPPAGAMDKGVTGADPANDPAQSLMAEATRLGGPLGGIAIGAATGATHHLDSQNQPNQIDKNDPHQVMQDPKFLALAPQDQHSVLMSIDPKFAALAPEDQQSVISNLPSRQGYGAANLGNEEIGTGPEGTTDINQLMSPASQADASKKGGMLAGAMAGALAAPAAATAVGGGLVGSIAGGAAAGGAQSVTSQLGEGENPFRLQMLKQTGEDVLGGAVAGGVLHGAGKVAGKIATGIANKFRGAVTPSVTEAAGLPAEITEQHFTPIPKEEIPVPRHGAPILGDQPFDNATIASMRQGKTLPTDAVSLLKSYVGDTIPSGSTPLNTTMGAVKHITQAINETGTEMASLMNKAPEFAQSAIEDSKVGTSLRDDIQAMRENLPLGPDSDPRNKVITTQLDAAHKALISRDPQEILAFRRKLGSQIDWDGIIKNPETDQETKNIAQARIYQALSDKLKQIPGVKELDEIFQPNLELRSYLNKILPEGVAFDPVEAESQRLSELAKGQKKLAIDAHNERIAQNISTAKKALGIAGTVATAAGAGALGGAAVRHAGTAAVPNPTP